jgi:hypothetical protein
MCWEKVRRFFRGFSLLALLTAIGLGFASIFATNQVGCQAAAGSKSEEIRFAILVGVGDYREPRLKLEFIQSDVRELRKVLQASGYDVLTLVDKEATKDSIRTILTDRLNRSNERTVFALYVNGHTVTDSSGEVFFLPVDADPRRLKETAIPVRWIRETIEGGKAKAKFLILDTCYASAAVRDGEALSPAPMHPSFQETPGVYVLASSQAHQKSYVWPLKGHSFFTYWLVQGLKGRADGFAEGGRADGNITADELFYYLRERVPDAASSQLQVEQVPDRIVGPGVPVDIPLVHVEPRGLKETLTEIAEELATVLQLRGRKVVGVLDFGISSKLAAAPLRPSVELSRECANAIEEWLTRKASGKFEVVLRESIQEILSSRGITTAEILPQELPELRFGSFTVEALIVGLLEEFKPPELRMRVCLRDARTPMLSYQLQSTVRLTQDDIPYLETSGTVPRRMKPETPELWQPLLEQAQEVHPMSDPNFPYRVYVLVQGQRRPGKFVGNQLYVPLAPGEVYCLELEVLDSVKRALIESGSIQISRGLEGFWEPILLVRVLVDGLSTLPEPPRVLREPPLAKAIMPAAKDRRLLPAQPTPIDEASPWVFPIKGATRRIIPGFLCEIKTEEQQSGHKVKISYTFNEFRVVKAEDLPQERWNYAEQLGIITVAFYTATPCESPTRSVEADIGTIPGEERKASGEAHTRVRPGELLAQIKLRYISREAWERLKGHQVKF